MGEHTGHRKRMKKYFLENGAQGLADHQILELLLFYALPRVDTNPLAHRLIDEFGDIEALLDAPAAELVSTPGLGESAAVLLKLIPELGRRYLAAKSQIGTILTCTEDAGRFLLPRFLGRRDETVMQVCLDAKLKVVSCRVVASGDVTTAHISVRKVVEQALSQNAPFVLLAHNHVSGFAIPSREDVTTTQQLQKALSLVGVTLVDHIIVAGDDFVSLLESGYMETDEEKEPEKLPE